jgi:low affinity Fe/Cu permease
MPSEVSSRLGFFDRLAGHAASISSRAPFFAVCAFLVAIWLLQGVVTILVTGDIHRFLDDKYQLEINTTTTIITYLLVALLQNSQTREDQATQHKLNAIADALADMMERMADRYEDERLRGDIRELRLAVGLEEREGTSNENPVKV